MQYLCLIYDDEKLIDNLPPAERGISRAVAGTRPGATVGAGASTIVSRPFDPARSSFIPGVARRARRL